MITLSVLGLLAIGCIAYGISLRRNARLRLPPGPKAWPIVGNVMDLAPPGVPDYQHWLKHKDLYGPISSVTVLGQTMVIVHGREVMNELLEKNSTKTASRPVFEFCGNLCGFGNFLGLRPYGSTFRKHRKFIHKQLGTQDLVSRYNGVMETEVAHLLQRVLDTPEDLFEHLEKETAGLILKIAYGYTVEPKGPDPLIDLIINMMRNLTASVLPMSWPVDLIPALKHLPEWFPGCSFKKTAKAWAQVNEAVIEIPYGFVRKRMKEGNSLPCYVSTHIDQETADGQRLKTESEEVIKITASQIYAGGSDTTVSSLSSFVLAMLKFPEVQRKGQEEIDGLTGGERLPQFSDREKLPYVNGIVQEVLRWFPVAPLGVAHYADEEVVVQGYTVPKGAIILPSIWWLLHDPETYDSPETFDPSRFLPPRNEPASEVAFGFGRRVCVGRHLADRSIFLTIAQMLATYQIERALDSEGKGIDPKVECVPGLVDRPKAFPYRITPRSPKHEDLIRKVQVNYPWEEGDSRTLPVPETLQHLIK